LIDLPENHDSAVLAFTDRSAKLVRLRGFARAEGKTLSGVVQYALRLARAPRLKREFKEAQGYWSRRRGRKGFSAKKISGDILASEGSFRQEHSDSSTGFPGKPAEKAVLRIIEGSDQLLVSKTIIDEVLEVLARKFARDVEDLAQVAFALETRRFQGLREFSHVLARAPGSHWFARLSFHRPRGLNGPVGIAIDGANA
jgi:hypothetical protein